MAAQLTAIVNRWCSGFATFLIGNPNSYPVTLLMATDDVINPQTRIEKESECIAMMHGHLSDEHGVCDACGASLELELFNQTCWSCAIALAWNPASPSLNWQIRQLAVWSPSFSVTPSGRTCRSSAKRRVHHFISCISSTQTIEDLILYTEYSEEYPPYSYNTWHYVMIFSTCLRIIIQRLVLQKWATFPQSRKTDSSVLLALRLTTLLGEEGLPCPLPPSKGNAMISYTRDRNELTYSQTWFTVRTHKKWILNGVAILNMSWIQKFHFPKNCTFRPRDAIWKNISHMCRTN